MRFVILYLVKQLLIMQYCCEASQYNFLVKEIVCRLEFLI
jgi:hypothetical protein